MDETQRQFLQAVENDICFHKTERATRELQTIGTAHAWDLLQRKGFAYIADEVGMGKTFQAFGIMSAFMKKHDRCLVLVLCPGYDMQKQWRDEWNVYVKQCYMATPRWEERQVKGDDAIKSMWTGGPAFEPAIHDRLKDFAEDLAIGQSKVHILRYSSFSFPIGFGQADDTDDGLRAIKDKFGLAMSELCMRDADISALQAGFAGTMEDFKQRANRVYCEMLSKILSCRSQELLVVFDEAQYLRRTDENNRTRNIRALLDRFRKDAGKTFRSLFLSATPIHADPKDVVALNDYLPEGSAFPPKPIIISDSADWQKSFEQFGLRRNRAYSDRQGRQLQKVVYREYREDPISLKDSPYHALVHAVVQKNLARVLDSGRNGGAFRLGELSSFESLDDSLLRSREKLVRDDGRVGTDDEPAQFKVLEHTTVRGRDKPKDPVDSTFIREMNKTYTKNCFGSDRNHALPHAKLDTVAENLAETCIRDGSVKKALVFVRRIATVSELIGKLRVSYQNEIDRRIGAWSRVADLKPGEYWLRGRRDTKDTSLPEGNDFSEDETIHEIRGSDLPYYQAIRGKSKNPDGPAGYGFLYSFRRRLGGDESPLRTCLIGENPKLWEALLRAIVSEESAEVQNDLLCRYAFSSAGSRETLSLRECILLYLRKTDFLVDLDIMNNFWEGNRGGLAQKLTNCLSPDGKFKGDVLLVTYFANWRKRLCELTKQFGILFSKVLKGKDAKDMGGFFKDMDIVAGRSSRLVSSAPLTQFNLPGYPNILVCTDVLKEGINLQYFCDSIVHYGVAWTSGDLEQRIGRVDRINCMYGRNVMCSSFPDSPRLRSTFPALQQTLDQFQVQKVMENKETHDSCMGGTHKQESPKVSVPDGGGGSEERLESGQFRDIIPQIGNPYSPFVSYADDRIGEFSMKTIAVNSMGRAIQTAMGGVEKWREENDKWTFVCNEGDDSAVYELRYLPRYSCFHLSQKIECDRNSYSSVVLRRTRGRRSKEFRYRYLLVPIDACEEAVVSELKVWRGLACEKNILVPDSRSLSSVGFSIPNGTDMPCREHTFQDPLDESAMGLQKQAVYACECSRSIVFMSHVCPSEFDESGVPLCPVADKNRDFDFGFFVETEMCGSPGVWYVAVVSANLKYGDSLLVDIVSHVAQTAARNRHLLAGKELAEPETPKAQWTIRSLEGGVPEDSRDALRSFLSSLREGQPMDVGLNVQPISLGLGVSRSVYQWIEDHLAGLSRKLPVREFVDEARPTFSIDPTSSLSSGLLHYNTDVFLADYGKYRMRCTLLFKTEGDPLVCWQFKATPNTRMQSIPMTDWSGYGSISDEKYLKCGRGLLYDGNDSAGQDVLRTCLLTHALPALDVENEGVGLTDHFPDIINAMHSGRFKVSSYNERILPFLS